ncbi:MAG: cysteine--tRNA ligase [Ruminococcus sp.]|nr:cysteine--tRNA ligase [Ruminococcus sp.]
MQIFNSLTRKKEEIATHESGKLSMYTCGPTVYHFAHIGNLRTYIMEDVLEKALRYEGLDVKRVMNITDVGHLTSDGDTGDDKMLKGAKREHKTVMEIAKFYTDAFFADCEKLNIKRPEVVEPATNNIAEFIKAVEKLMETGYAYEAGGNIYFDTSKLGKYYVFGDVSEDDLEVGVRDGVEADSNKRNKADFVLWFTKSKFDDQELKWDSPWGIGYPGWHIECSCIAMKHCGEYLDLHCGGIDNQFPHHTNEIAQSEALIGHQWCPSWFHVHHLNTSGGKMSKSKGEFLTVSLLEEKGYDPLVYRFFCLQSHYRKTLTFDWENLNNANGAYEKLVARIAAVYSEQPSEGSAQKAEELKKAFTEAICNDLNTAQAVTVLYDLLKADISKDQKLDLIKSFDSVLGLDLIGHAEAQLKAQQDAESDVPAEVAELVEKRREARKAKDFALADELRDKISELGWEVKETREGTKVYKK